MKIIKLEDNKFVNPQYVASVERICGGYGARIRLMNGFSHDIPTKTIEDERKLIKKIVQAVERSK